MASFNSKNAGRRRFNVRHAEKAKKKFLTTLFQLGSEGRYATHREHPEYYHVNAAATNAIKHYLKGCDSCGTQPVTNPSVEAMQLLGIRNEEGRLAPRINPSGPVEQLHWHGDRCTYSGKPHRWSRIATMPKLADYLKITGSTRGGHFKGSLYDAFLQPRTRLGYDSSGDMVLAGQMTTPGGRKVETDPHSLMQQVKFARDAAFTGLIKNGVTDIKPYFEVHKLLSHMEHGSDKQLITPDKKLITPDSPEWEDLQPGQRPLNTHWSMNGWLKNIAGQMDPATVDPKLHHMLDRAKTADFVGCHCPACALNEAAYGSNSYIDVQDLNKAFNSSEPELKQAVRCEKGGYPMLYSEETGRISDLGPQGKKTPHRMFMLHPAAQTYIEHVVNSREDAQHRGYTGAEVAVPPQEIITPEHIERTLSRNVED